MEDASLLVAKQYTDFAYPEPITDIAQEISKGCFQYGDPSLYEALLWPEGRPKGDLSILVAGCGTIQAAWLAFTNPTCEVVGVDLSEASLSHQRFLQERHGLKNLRLIKGDLRRVAELKTSFDYVVSTGVIHHMSDPLQGLKALRSVLKDDGVFCGMVYATSGRMGVYYLQEVFKSLRLEQNAEGIELVKATLKSLPANHYVRKYLSKASDLTTDAGLVDTFLHPQDRSYNVIELLSLISDSGLSFQTWIDNGNYYPSGNIWNYAIFDRVRKLSLPEQWSIVEKIQTDNGCHFFVACSPERVHRTKIDFSSQQFLNYYPVRHHAMKVVEQASVNPDRPGSFTREAAQFKLTPAEAFLISMSDGKASVKSILQHEYFKNNNTAVLQGAVKEFFQTMYEFGHMFMSKAPVGN